MLEGKTHVLRFLQEQTLEGTLLALLVYKEVDGFGRQVQNKGRRQTSEEDGARLEADVEVLHVDLVRGGQGRFTGGTAAA